MGKLMDDKSYISNSIKLYNSLPNQLKTLPYATFKTKIKQLLLDLLLLR